LLNKISDNNYKIRKFMNEDIEVLTSIYMDTYTQDPWNENWTPELVRQRISDLTVSPISINYVICDKSNAIVGALFGRMKVFIVNESTGF